MNFGKYQKDEILAKQKNRCNKCNVRFGKIKPHFDHIDGNKTNNQTSNGQALCPNCHDRKSRRQTTSRSKKQKRDDPFGFGKIDFGFGNSKKDSDNPFTW